MAKKSIFTRMCIGEAVLALLKDNPLKQLKISAVVLKAGVSRMTFYKYYVSLQAALEDYLHLIISEYIEQSKQEQSWHSFLSYEHILFTLNFFDRYRSFFLTMKKQGLYSLLMDNVNRFVAEHIPLTEKVNVYQRYSFAGSILNCFMMWQENGKKDSPEAVARTIYQLYGLPST